MYMHLLHLFTKKIKHTFNVKCNSRVYSLAFKINCPHDFYLLLPGETLQPIASSTPLESYKQSCQFTALMLFCSIASYLVSCARYPWVERVHKYCKVACPRLQCYLEDLTNNSWRRQYLIHSLIADGLYCEVHATHFT